METPMPERDSGRVAEERLERAVNAGLDAEILVNDRTQEVMAKINELRDATVVLAKARKELAAAVREAMTL